MNLFIQNLFKKRKTIAAAAIAAIAEEWNVKNRPYPNVDNNTKSIYIKQYSIFIQIAITHRYWIYLPGQNTDTVPSMCPNATFPIFFGCQRNWHTSKLKFCASLCIDNPPLVL